MERERERERERGSETWQKHSDPTSSSKDNLCKSNGDHRRSTRYKLLRHAERLFKKELERQRKATVCVDESGFCP